MKINKFMRNISFILITCIIGSSSLFCSITPAQLTQLNSNKRSLKNTLGELINCLDQERPCDAEMKKTLKHMTAILDTLKNVLSDDIKAHNHTESISDQLAPYELFIRQTGYEEKYEESFRKLITALQNDDIDQLKDAIKIGALYYPDSKFALFTAQSADAVYYLLANYPYNKNEMLNAEKQFPTAGIGSDGIIRSPLTHHKMVDQSDDVITSLIQLGAQEISRPYTQ